MLLYSVLFILLHFYVKTLTLFLFLEMLSFTQQIDQVKLLLSATSCTGGVSVSFTVTEINVAVIYQNQTLEQILV